MIRWICGIILTILLAGCSTPLPSEHRLIFTPGQFTVKGGAQEELDSFVAPFSSNTCFELDGPRSMGGFFDPVTVHRVLELWGYLETFGYVVIIPREPFWADTGPISLLMRTCRGKAA